MSNKIVLAFALVCSACIRFPGNDLVIVQIEESIKSNAEAVSSIKEGIRQWDAVGARFRTLDQVLPDEVDKARYAPALRFTGDYNEADPDEAAYYERGLGIINLHLFFWDKQPKDALIHLVAHEIGHSMGLQHLTEPEAIMNHNTTLNLTLTESDINEYYRVWGSQ